MNRKPGEVLINNLKVHRKRLKLSQETLAIKADISLWTYRRIESFKSEPMSYTLFKIARAIGISPDDIFFIINRDQLESYKQKLLKI